jgi:hypothetical protein
VVRTFRVNEAQDYFCIHCHDHGKAIKDMLSCDEIVITYQNGKNDLKDSKCSFWNFYDKLVL